VRNTSAFIGPLTSTFNHHFAVKDLLKSGLTLDDIQGFAGETLQLVEGATAGYLIPYFGLDGAVLTDNQGNASMYRIRLEFPPYHKAAKYTQPSAEELLKHGLPSFIPYLYPCADLPAEVLYCCEGEKKTASLVTHLKLAAFGIAGCHMWKNPAGTGGLHPWILDYLKQRSTTKVIIIPDGDIFKYDICAAYGTFAHALLTAGFQVELLNPPGKIDDLIAAGGLDLSAIPRLTPNQLVQSPGQLAVAYDLAFKRSGPKMDKLIVHQHSSNVMRLLRDHPAFEKIWLNRDTNDLMLGEKPAEPDKTEVDLANHMQHNFGLDKVTPQLVRACMRALSKENERSPMLDFIKAQMWDGTPRLDTWMVDTWGVTDTAYSREVASKWLISACARMDKPGSKVDWMLIVIGPQATGKTSMPGIVFRGHATTMYGESNDKDTHLKLHATLCIGFDELDSFSRKDAEFLKAMITSSEDMFRPPYGATIEKFKRRFTLYGCGNRNEFLQEDSSGHRRYAVIQVNRLLDFARLEAMVPQLWAEAWARYTTQGGDWWEVKGASEEAQQYVMRPVVQDQIESWLAAQTAAKNPFFWIANKLSFTMSDLLMGIDAGRVSIPQQKEIAGILQKLGYSRRSVRVNGEPKKRYILDD
jgi:hypothetical protein